MKKLITQCSIPSPFMIAGLVSITLAIMPRSTQAQLSIAATNTPYVITFDASLADVANGAFTGVGFQSSPNLGELDSDAWANTGMSDGPLAFGGTGTIGDQARGTSAGGVTTTGFYAFTAAAIGSNALGIQPSGTDWTPGTLTLRVQNTSGSPLNRLDVAYALWVNNDQARANSFNFSFSTDNVTYSPLGALDYTSTAALDASGFQVNNRSTSLTGLSVANNAYIYLRWEGDDVSGTGGRDEFALDDISVTGFLEGCMDPLAENYDAAATTDNGSCTYCAPTITYNDAIPTPIVIGTGLPADNAAVSVDCHPFTVGLTAYNRFVGAIIPTGNVYNTTTGHSPISQGSPTDDPVAARWNFLTSIDLGTFDFTEVQAYMDLDFDPDTIPVWNVFDISAFAASQGVEGQSVLQSSENLASPFWGTVFPGVTLDTDVPGIYDMRLRLESLIGAELLTLSIQIVVEGPMLSAPALPDFGTVCLNDTAGPIGTTITGTNLTAADVTVAAVPGFAYSTSEFGTYTTSLTIPQPGGAFSQPLWVIFTPTAVQSYDGFIVIGGGGAADSTTAVTGSGAVPAPIIMATGDTISTTPGQAEIAGSIISVGCDPLLTYGITYSTTSAFDPAAGTFVASSNLAGTDYSSIVTGLDGCTTYYYRAYGTTATDTVYGNEDSFDTDGIEPPVATFPAVVNGTDFTATWNPTPGATGYFLDVSTSPTFGNTSPLTVTTGFSTAPIPPAGWTFTSIGAYASPFGVATPSLKFDATGDMVTTPLFSGAATDLSFWIRGLAAGASSSLLVEGFNGTVWSTIEDIVPIPSVGTTKSYTGLGPNNYTRFRFTFTKVSGTVATDDISYTYLGGSTPSYLPGYENLPVAGTSQVVSGLIPQTIYYYRVRAIGTSCPVTNNSNVIAVTTGCTAHAGNVWYVNDDSTTGDVYTASTGNIGNPGTAECPFRRIGFAISQAAAGDTILVDAGTYAEDLIVDKRLDLRGAQYNADPTTRTGTETILHPATSDPDPISPTAVVMIYLADDNASRTSINGFTIDGDNPGLTSGVVYNGADMDAIEGVGSNVGNDSLDIAFNIIKNLSYAGVDLNNYLGIGTLAENRVRNNAIDNAYSADWGMGVIIQYNLYADITNNTMNRVKIGIQTGNFSLPTIGSDPIISGNTITSYRRGIWHNAQYATASPFSIIGNELLTESSSTTNNGLMISALDPAVTVIVQNNNVTDAAYGVMLWGNQNNVPVTIQGGSLTDCDTAVFINNYDGYNTASTDTCYAILTDVSIANALGVGIHVKDNALNTDPQALVHIDIQGTTTVNVANGGINLLITGGKASAEVIGNAVNLTGSPSRYVRLQSNGTTFANKALLAEQVKFNGAYATVASGFAIEDKIDHKVDLLNLGRVRFMPGELFVTLNSFISPNVTGSVQRGINAALNGDILHVNNGTYNQDVNVNKPITVVGNDRDLTILRGKYSTSVPSLSIGSGAKVQSLTVTRDFGANLAAWQSSPKPHGVRFNGSNASIDNLLVTGNRIGVYINNKQNITVTNSVIESNRTGILLANNASGNSITNNFIQNNFSVGLLFNFILTGTPNTADLVVSENSMTGNWYADLSYKGTPSSPVSGATFSCNWYGVDPPVVVPAATGEPAYASQVPVQFGGTAPAPPPGQIMGISAGLIPYEPFGTNGTDDDPATAGFQPVIGSCEITYYSQASGTVEDPIWDKIPVGTPGPAIFSSIANMVVQDTHQVDVSTAVNVQNITVDPLGALILNSGSSITVNGFEAIFYGPLTAQDSSNLVMAGSDVSILTSFAGPLDLWDFTINSPVGTVTDDTIAIRGTLQLTDGVLDVSGGAVTLTSTSAGTGRLGPVGVTGSFSGALTMERYVPAGHTDWRLLGSAVQGATIGDWMDDFFTAGFPGSAYPNFYSPPGSGIFWPSIRWYDETNLGASADSGYVGVSSNAHPLTPGMGFIAWSGDNLSTTTDFVVDVTGTPNIAYSPITLPMSWTSTGVLEADGWNMVSNPLPSPIDFAAISLGADVRNQYSIFDPVSGTTLAWTNGVGQGGADGIIQSSQGFILKTDGPILTSTVSEDDKVAAPVGGVFGGSQQAILPILRLVVSSDLNAFNDEATIVFDEGSPAMDDMDAMKFTFASPGAPLISVQSSDAKALAIDFFGTYSTSITIPVMVKASLTGTYTITAGMTGINGLTCLTLEDLVTGTVTPLTDGSDHSFEMDAGADATSPRFLLHASAPLPILVNAPLCGDMPGTVSVTVTDGPVDINWTDAFGNTQLLAEDVANGISEFTAMAGNYMVHVTPGGACAELIGEFSIHAPPAIETAQVAATSTSCPDTDDGTIAIQVLGGMSPYVYLWDDGSTTENMTGPAGDHTVVVSDANGCTDTSILTIEAGIGPIAGFTVNDTLLLVNTPITFSNTSVAGESWLWDFGDGTTSTEMDPTHEWVVPGFYNVILTVTSGSCTDMFSLELLMESSTGITAETDAHTIQAWATPIDFVVVHDFGKQPVQVDIYDATGRLAISKTITHADRILIPNKDQSTGIWYMRVRSGDVQHSFRVPLVR